jgi:hypothetical protein
MLDKHEIYFATDADGNERSVLASIETVEAIGENRSPTASVVRLFSSPSANSISTSRRHEAALPAASSGDLRVRIA